MLREALLPGRVGQQAKPQVTLPEKMPPGAGHSCSVSWALPRDVAWSRASGRSWWLKARAHPKLEASLIIQQASEKWLLWSARKVQVS